MTFFKSFMRKMFSYTTVEVGIVRTDIDGKEEASCAETQDQYDVGKRTKQEILNFYDHLAKLQINDWQMRKQLYELKIQSDPDYAKKKEALAKEREAYRLENVRRWNAKNKPPNCS